MDANWIIAPEDPGTAAVEFRREIVLSGTVKKATAAVTAMGIYYLLVNGTKVGDALFAPGWTSYTHRVQCKTYDLTELLTGRPVLSLLLGKGWAAGRIGYKSETPVYYDRQAICAHFRVEYEDGRVEEFCTDPSWQVYTTQVLFHDFYDGETLDRTAPCRLLGNALPDPCSRPAIVEQVGEDVVEQERMTPCALITTPKGETVLDFGQNLAGYVEIRIRGRRGDRIVLTHAEVLDRDGNFYTDNLRSAENRVTYVLSGEGEELFKPWFSFQGFRYLRLDEFPDDLEVCLENFTAVAVYSRMKRTGDFICGNGKINQLYRNILWGQRGNFIDIPTDCPQRDERLGWTGDAQVFCRTAAIQYDVERFFRKWFGDLRLEQGENGSVAGVVPCRILNGAPSFSQTSAGWGDAAVICPWEIYRAYGDKELLRENFDMMKKWVGYMRSFGEEEFLFVGGYHYGDWLALDAGDGQYTGATQTDLIASAFFAYSTSLVVKAGKILGEDVAEYEELYKNVRAAFRKAFMKDGLPCLYPKADALSDKRPVKGLTQTALVLVLHFGLCEETERQGLVAKLAELIAENGGRMTTGFLGTPYLLHALSENGRSDLAYDLLLQEKAPSWLFSVNQGATTIWEHWDSLKEDGTFWSVSMNSFNHYAYGAVFDWIFGVSLGITVADGGAGYEKITVAPVPDQRLGFAKGSVDSRRGKIESEWHILPDGRVRYGITVPSGTTAEICLPGEPVVTFSGGRYEKIV